MFRRKQSDELAAMTKRAVAAEAALNDSARLISLTREGRVIRFRFRRNNQLYDVQCMGTWDDDVDQWQQDLLR